MLAKMFPCSSGFPGPFRELYNSPLASICSLQLLWPAYVPRLAWECKIPRVGHSGPAPKGHHVRRDRDPERCALAQAEVKNHMLAGRPDGGVPVGGVVDLGQRGVLVSARRLKVRAAGIHREAAEAGPDLLRDDVVAILADRAVAATGAPFGLDVDECEQGLVPVHVIGKSVITM